MRRWIVVAAVVVLVLALPVVAQAQEEDDNTCRPWTTWTPWSVIFCDYSLWDLYEGLLGWIWGEDGASRGWYGEEPPTDGVWTRWCWFKRVDIAPVCSWSTSFSAEVVSDQRGPGAHVDPPWFSSSDFVNTAVYVGLVTPPGTTQVTMLCRWVVTAKSNHTSASGGVWWGNHNPVGPTVGPLMGLTTRVNGETFVSDEQLLVYEADIGKTFVHTHPVVYEDHSNYIHWRFGARSNVVGGTEQRTASSSAYVECEVVELTIGGVPQVPEDVHKWFEENGPIEPPGIGQPIGYDRIGFNPITPISQTIEFEVGTPGVPACLSLVPQVGPYTVTIPTWGDWGVGWDSFEICVRESQFTLKLLDINFGSWIISLFLLAGAFFLVRVIMT